MTVSVCMIVKNEEALLPRALERLAALADELVIVDTGSSDGTRALALAYTPHVYDYVWCNDFAAARNFAFSKCTMDYIYTADADEILDQDNAEKLRQLLKTLPEHIDAVQMYYTNQQEQGAVYNYDTEYRPKLMRRLRPARWVDPIHETLDTEYHVFNSDIAIIHKPTAKHQKRDFGIYRRVAAPGCLLSPRLHRLYAQELFLAGDREDFIEASAYFNWTLDQEAMTPDMVKQSQCVVTYCCATNKDEAGLYRAALKNAVGRPSAEVCTLLGDFYLEKNDPEEAATWYYTAAFGAECELSARMGGDLPLLGLSKCYALLDLPDEAEKYKLMAKEWHV